MSLPVGETTDYFERIQALPLNPAPEVFFLHDNAEITTNEAATMEFIDTVISIRPNQVGSSSKSRE